MMMWVWPLNSFDTDTRTLYKNKELMDKSIVVASLYSMQDCSSFTHEIPGKISCYEKSDVNVLYKAFFVNLLSAAFVSIM